VTGRISGVYGSQRILNGKPKRPHYGVDIAAPTGTPVKAPADGVVSMVHNDMFYSGGTLIVDHGHGLSTVYMHLHKILVEERAAGQTGRRHRPGGRHRSCHRPPSALGHELVRHPAGSVAAGAAHAETGSDF
jgi:hypothetical protein